MTLNIFIYIIYTLRTHTIHTLIYTLCTHTTRTLIYTLRTHTTHTLMTLNIFTYPLHSL